MASTFDNRPTGRDPAPDPDQRISDADRQRVAEVVSEAAAVGYLDLSELDERLETVWGARTAGQLALATADLPPEWLRGRQQPHRPGPSSRPRPGSGRPRGGTSPDFQRHLMSYLVGMAVMVTIWLAVGISSGSWYPWIIWPALGWGVGVAARACRGPATPA